MIGKWQQPLSACHLRRFSTWTWTLEVIAMRAFGDPDAFAATDMGVMKGAAMIRLLATPAALIARSRRWQP